MRRTVAFGSVAGILILSLGFAAPAQAAETVSGAPPTLPGLEQRVPSSVVAGVSPDGGQGAQVANQTNRTAVENADKPISGKLVPGSGNVPAQRFAPPMTTTTRMAVGGVGLNAGIGLAQGFVGLFASGYSAVTGVDANNAACVGSPSGPGESVPLVTYLGFDCSGIDKPGGQQTNSDQAVTYVGTKATNIPATVNNEPANVDVKPIWAGTQVTNYSGYATVCSVVTWTGTDDRVIGTALSDKGKLGVSGVGGVYGNGYNQHNDYRGRMYLGTGNGYSTAAEGASGSGLAGQNLYNLCVSKGANAFSWIPMGEYGVYATVTWSDLRGYGLAQAIAPAAQQRANPTRVFKCSVTTTAGDVYAAESATFTENDDTYPQPICPPLPVDKVAQRVVVTEKVTSTGVERPVMTPDMNPGYQKWANDFPQCLDGHCVLELKKHLPAGDVSCLNSPGDCVNWITDPLREQAYQCVYDGVNQALSECFIYGPTFQPDCLDKGSCYGDPSTGKEVVAPTTVPRDQDLLKRLASDRNGRRTCFPYGYDGTPNPVQWVMQPAMCALEWAFVPTAADVKQRVLDTSYAWNQTAPAQMSAVIQGWGQMWPYLDGCEGPRVVFNFKESGGDYYPLDACPGSQLEFVAGASRAIGAITIYFGAVLAISRYLAASIGYTGLGSGKGNE